jgi:hypothetical protein
MARSHHDTSDTLVRTFLYGLFTHAQLDGKV